MYDDYAISETLFHCNLIMLMDQKHPKVSYINHKEIDKKILTFLLEKGKDEMEIQWVMFLLKNF
jgi:hypothetical protein